MQAREVLHKLLIKTCGEMHAVRREALETVVWAGLTSQRMTVTGLGRAIGGIAREKHNIKRADRLLSNPHLQSEREVMYGVLARRLVGSQRHPVLLVDWSDLDEWRRNQVVRVSLAVEGRALTVYEEVHGRKTTPELRILNNNDCAWHQYFVGIPQGLSPITLHCASRPAG